MQGNRNLPAYQLCVSDDATIGSESNDISMCSGTCGFHLLVFFFLPAHASILTSPTITDIRYQCAIRPFSVSVNTGIMLFSSQARRMYNSTAIIVV
jgi:hypothetical protein